jgi:methylated-DNA-protein-cysteine methyltransferase related protein
VTGFARRVLNVVGRVPPGRVLTYGDVAGLAGRRAAARAVGNILRTAHVPGLPYHRIVGAGGRIGGYGDSPHLKAVLLAAEGLVIRRRRIADFARVRWRPPVRPSTSLRRPSHRARNR